MGTEATRSVMVEAWMAFATGDKEQIASWLAPDAVWIAPEDNATAKAMNGESRIAGRDAIVRFLVDDYPSVFRDATFEPLGMFADGNTAITESRLTATLPHGGYYSNDYCFFFEVVDGKIQTVREYMDTAKGAKWFDTPHDLPIANGEGEDDPTVRPRW